MFQNVGNSEKCLIIFFPYQKRFLKSLSHVESKHEIERNPVKQLERILLSTNICNNTLCFV